MNLEVYIKDPVSGACIDKPFERLQRANCEKQHLFSLPIAIQLFGEMRNGAATKPTPCPLCNGLVTSYITDPRFQDVADAVNNLAKSQGEAPSSSSVTPMAATPPAQAAATSLQPAGTQPSRCGEEYARNRQTQYDQEGTQQGRVQGVNNTDMPGNVTFNIDKVVTSDTSPITQCYTSGNDKYYFANISKGATVGSFAMGPGAQSFTSKNINHNTTFGPIGIGATVGASTMGPDARGYSYRTDVAQGNVQGSSYQDQWSASSSNLSKFHLQAGQVLNLPDNSKNCAIKGNDGSVINIGENCQNLTIESGVGNVINLGDNCRNIRVTTNIGVVVNDGNNCHNIFVDGNKIA